MPDAVPSVVSSKECCQPMELHGLVDRPTGSDGKEARYRNSEVCCPLERVVLCVANIARMRAIDAALVWRRENLSVVSKHPERVKQVGSVRQQRAPPSSHHQPCNVQRAIQHE